jgi:lysophospholipase L1-like esterase
MRTLCLAAFCLIVNACSENAQKHKATCGLICLGDSYMAGTNIDPQGTFPYLLSRQAGLFNDCDSTVTTVIAQKGWTSGQLLFALPDTVYDGEMITLLIGVNDQYDGLPLEEFSQNLMQICKWIKRQAPGKPVVILTIPDYGVTPYSKMRGLDPGSTIDVFNEEIYKIARLFDFQVVDVTSSYREIGQLPENLSSDSLHPSASVYANWADKVQQLFQK